MKAIGGLLFGAAILWVFWSLLGKGECEQVHRFAEPVNLVMYATRELSANWIEKDTKLDLLYLSVEAREATEKVVARTFYSKELSCGWGKGS